MRDKLEMSGAALMVILPMPLPPVSEPLSLRYTSKVISVPGSSVAGPFIAHLCLLINDIYHSKNGVIFVSDTGGCHG